MERERGQAMPEGRCTYPTPEGPAMSSSIGVRVRLIQERVAGERKAVAGLKVHPRGVRPRCVLPHQVVSVEKGPSVHCKLSPSVMTNATVWRGGDGGGGGEGGGGGGGEGVGSDWAEGPALLSAARLMQ